MNKTAQSQQGKVSIIALVSVAIVLIASAYLVIDNKADNQALASIEEFIDKAQDEGLELSYSDIDASPIFANVIIKDLQIKGRPQEADVHFGSIKISGIPWRTLMQPQPQLAEKMDIVIEDSSVTLKSTMVEHNLQLQQFVARFGEQLLFSAHYAYQLDLDTESLNVTTKTSIVDNISIETNFNLGGVNWLTNLSASDADEKSVADLMTTTLNSLSITLVNQGFIAKLRAMAAENTGLTEQELQKKAIKDIEQLRLIAQYKWGDIFNPMIEQLLIFNDDPQQLNLNISPEQALTTGDILSAYMGGDSGLLALIQQAKLELKAN